MRRLFGGKQAKNETGGDDKELRGQVFIVNKHHVAVESKLAEGGFAIVYVVRCQQTGRHYALKRMFVNDSRQLEAAKREIRIVQSLSDHRHIVRYIDSSISPVGSTGDGVYECMLLSKFYKKSVLQLMNERLAANTHLSEREVLCIFCDVCDAVARLHHAQTPVIHRDLKVENVLFDDNGACVLCDFGSATTKVFSSVSHPIALIEEEIQKYTTLSYRSPEMVDLYSGQAITTKSDIWALGILLYKLCYFTLPFGESSLAIQNASFVVPDLPEYSDSLVALICYLLNPSAAERPDIYQVAHVASRLNNRKCDVGNLSGTQVPSLTNLVSTFKHRRIPSNELHNKPGQQSLAQNNKSSLNAPAETKTTVTPRERPKGLIQPNAQLALPSGALWKPSKMSESVSHPDSMVAAAASDTEHTQPEAVPSSQSMYSMDSASSANNPRTVAAADEPAPPDNGNPFLQATPDSPSKRAVPSTVLPRLSADHPVLSPAAPFMRTYSHRRNVSDTSAVFGTNVPSAMAQFAASRQHTILTSSRPSAFRPYNQQGSGDLPSQQRSSESLPQTVVHASTSLDCMPPPRCIDNSFDPRGSEVASSSVTAKPSANQEAPKCTNQEHVDSGAGSTPSNETTIGANGAAQNSNDTPAGSLSSLGATAAPDWNPFAGAPNPVDRRGKKGGRGRGDLDDVSFGRSFDRLPRRGSNSSTTNVKSRESLIMEIKEADPFGAAPFDPDRSRRSKGSAEGAKAHTATTPSEGTPTAPPAIRTSSPSLASNDTHASRRYRKLLDEEEDMDAGSPHRLQVATRAIGEVDSIGSCSSLQRSMHGITTDESELEDGVDQTHKARPLANGHPPKTWSSGYYGYETFQQSSSGVEHSSADEDRTETLTEREPAASKSKPDEQRRMSAMEQVVEQLGHRPLLDDDELDCGGRRSARSSDGETDTGTLRTLNAETGDSAVALDSIERSHHASSSATSGDVVEGGQQDSAATTTEDEDRQLITTKASSSAKFTSAPHTLPKSAKSVPRVHTPTTKPAKPIPPPKPNTSTIAARLAAAAHRASPTTHSHTAPVLDTSSSEDESDYEPTDDDEEAAVLGGSTGGASRCSSRGPGLKARVGRRKRQPAKSQANKEHPAATAIELGQPGISFINTSFQTNDDEQQREWQRHRGHHQPQESLTSL